MLRPNFVQYVPLSGERDPVNGFERQPVAAIKWHSHDTYLYFGWRMRHSPWFAERSGERVSFATFDSRSYSNLASRCPACLRLYSAQQGAGGGR